MKSRPYSGPTSSNWPTSAPTPKLRKISWPLGNRSARIDRQGRACGDDCRGECLAQSERNDHEVKAAHKLSWNCMIIQTEIEKTFTRRAFLTRSTTGLGAIALGALLRQDLFGATAPM